MNLLKRIEVLLDKHPIFFPVMISVFYLLLGLASILNRPDIFLVLASIFIFLVVICILFYGGKFVSLFLKGYRIQRGIYSGNPYYQEIEACTKGGSESDKQYHLCLYYINKIYSGPIMAEIIKNKELEQLYQRKDLLEKNLAVPSLMVKILSLPIGAAIAVFMNWLISSNFEFFTIPILTDIVSRVLLISILAMPIAMVIVVIFCTFKGKAGSYLHEIRNYELKKIDECLYAIYEDIAEGFDGKEKAALEIKMSIQKTQRIANSLLIDRRRSGLKAAVKIMKFNLDNIDILNCMPVEAAIKNRQVIFMLDKNKWNREEVCSDCGDCKFKKITENQFEEMLISKDYLYLYQQLKKHYKQKMVLDERYVIRASER